MRLRTVLDFLCLSCKSTIATLRSLKDVNLKSFSSCGDSFLLKSARTDLNPSSILNMARSTSKALKSGENDDIESLRHDGLTQHFRNI